MGLEWGPVGLLSLILGRGISATYVTTNRTIVVFDPALQVNYTRTYMLHGPDAKPSSPVPLVIGFHGQSGTGAVQRWRCLPRHKRACGPRNW